MSIDLSKVQALLALAAARGTSIAEFAGQYPAFFAGMLETLAGVAPSWTDQQRQRARQRVLDAIGRQMLAQQGVQASTGCVGLPVMLQIESR